MRTGWRQIALIGVMLATTDSARAQTVDPARTGGQTFQIGGDIDLLTAAASEDGAGAATLANVRVTAPIARHFALEGLVSLPAGSDSYGLYAIQVRQRIVAASRAGSDVFATYGAFGLFSYEYRELIPPVFALAGVGVERRVAPRLAMRFDVQGFVCPIYPVVGFRLTAGISVPLGKLR